MTPEIPQSQTPPVAPVAAPTPQTPQIQTSVPAADTSTEPQTSNAKNVILANKGLIIAVLIATIVAVVGISSFLNQGQSDKFQGMIQKVEQDTQDLSR